ncbi:Neprosin domain-containing protein, partial [Dioscorea alata]
EEDLELERQLKLLNKPAIKTIVENGDIFDCVDIYKQPAFDHPSLKDHKLQHTPYNSKDNKYLGASAFITVYGHPQLTSTQFTSSLIFVENDLNPDGSNIIKVGWTRDDFHGTGCIDIRCPGFVQVNKEMPLGANISPLSVYNGVQYGMNFLLLRQDTSTSNWWLILKDDLKSIGYWPKEIFTTMSDHANWLSFGGVAGYYGTDSKMPPMGSGHFPFEGVNKSCVFVKVKNINTNSEWVDLPPKDVSPNSHSQCYGLGSFIDTKTSYGNMFYFGGPGG